MSRIGRSPIVIPPNIEVKLEGGNVIFAKGPRGESRMPCHERISCELKEGQLTVHRSTDLPQDRSLHGLMRALLNNLIVGVSEGFTRELLLTGVGYRAQVEGKTLVLHVGFTHEVRYKIPEGIVIELPKPIHIVIKGIDKQRVGQTAAEIRAVKPPEPYKGKGIRYSNEQVRRKAGKAAKGIGKK